MLHMNPSENKISESNPGICPLFPPWKVGSDGLRSGKTLPAANPLYFIKAGFDESYLFLVLGPGILMKAEAVVSTHPGRSRRYLVVIL